MGTFEFESSSCCCDNSKSVSAGNTGCGNTCNNTCNNTCSNTCGSVGSGNVNGSNSKEDCIIAHKIYDQCRTQICLTPDMLGPARASGCNCSDMIQEGDIIVPPPNATNVTIENFRLCRISIIKKRPNAFRPGYWDIEARFIFNYTLIFRTSDGCEICRTNADSVYNLKTILFGSIGTGIVMTSDLIRTDDNSGVVSADPFVSVEGKAVALAAELKYACCGCNSGCGCGCNSGCSSCGSGCGCNSCGCNNDCSCGISNTPVSVDVTIGLFAIIKVFRLVNLLVPSSGICMPQECATVSGADTPCDFFDSIDFPMEIFTPPANPDYFANKAKKCCDSNSCCSNR